MKKHSVRITAVVVVLMVFGFITLSPFFGFNLNLSETAREIVLATAAALVLIMGLVYFLQPRRLATVNATR